MTMKTLKCHNDGCQNLIQRKRPRAGARCEDCRATAHRECNRRYARRYRAEHREECREYNRRYRAEHRGECREYSRRYYAENREERRYARRRYRAEHRGECREYNRRYYAENRGGRYREYERRRRALKRGSDSGHVTRLWDAALLHHQRGICRIPGCGYMAEHLDHAKPLSRGGPHNIENCRTLLCARHNTSKGARTFIEWLGYDIKCQVPETERAFIRALNRLNGKARLKELPPAEAS